MEWDKQIESWGFQWVNDYVERAFTVHNGREISIMAFEDDEFEVAWLDADNNVREKGVTGMEELKAVVDELRK